MLKTVRIGIIGSGFARRVQIPAFLKCGGVEVVSIASRSLENAGSTANEFGIGHFTDDWRETVSLNEIDLVCITTPPDLHCEMTLAALASGKSVLCEKPMAMNWAEAEKMTQAAEESGCLALIDFELRFQPGRQAAYQMLRAGLLGKIRHAKWNFRAPHRGDPDLPWTWWSDQARGGGALGAIGSHVIDSFHWLLGTRVNSVFCQLQSQIKKRPYGESIRDVTSDDEVLMSLRFADSDFTEDATGSVSISMVEPPTYMNRIEVFGTAGALRIDHRGDVYLSRDCRAAWERVNTPLGKNLPRMQDTGFPRAFREFAKILVGAIRDGNHQFEHAPTFTDGSEVQRVLDAARRSDRLRKAIDL